MDTFGVVYSTPRCMTPPDGVFSGPKTRHLRLVFRWVGVLCGVSLPRPTLDFHAVELGLLALFKP